MIPPVSGPSHGRAILYALIAGVLWSTGGLLIKLITWQPAAIAGARSAIALIILLPLARIRLRRITILTVVSGIAYALTMITYVLGNRFTTAANTILLQYTAPIYVAILSWWVLGEPVRRNDWLSIGLVMGGVGLILTERVGGGAFAGNLIALASGVFFSIFLITLRMQKDARPLDAVVIGNILMAIVAIPAYAPFPTDTVSWVAVVTLGIGQVALPYVIYTHAIRTITAVEAVIIKGIEPVLNPLWVFLVIGELPTIPALFGGSVVLITITVRNLQRRGGFRTASGTRDSG